MIRSAIVTPRCTQEARARAEAAASRQHARQAQDAAAAQAARTAHEEAARSQQQRHSKRSTELDRDITSLNGAAACLMRCAAFLGAAAARVRPAAAEWEYHATGAPPADSPAACLASDQVPAEHASEAEAGHTAWSWGATSHSMDDTCRHTDSVPGTVGQDGAGRGHRGSEEGAGVREPEEERRELWEGKNAGEMYEEAVRLSKEGEEVVAEVQASQDALVATGRAQSTTAAMAELYETAARTAKAKEDECQAAVRGLVYA